MQLLKYKYEPIIDRNFNVFGFEVLHKNAYQLDWDQMDVLRLNSNLVEQLKEIFDQWCVKHYHCGCRFFLNVERRQFKDRNLLRKIAELSTIMREKFGVTIIFELTERRIDDLPIKELVARKLEFKLNLAADDVTQHDLRLNEIKYGLYNFVKFDDTVLNLNDHAEIEQLMEDLKLKFDCKFIAEKIDSPKLHSTAHALPFDYFQGYLYMNASHRWANEVIATG
ncbi:TPA: EAL domain-containing protein [Vibrio parahaemolyticus]